MKQTELIDDHQNILIPIIILGSGPMASTATFLIGYDPWMVRTSRTTLGGF
jgi:hypothetical protein